MPPSPPSNSEDGILDPRAVADRRNSATRTAPALVRCWRSYGIEPVGAVWETNLPNFFSLGPFEGEAMVRLPSVYKGSRPKSLGGDGGI
jgi:hypothetical protein